MIIVLQHPLLFAEKYQIIWYENLEFLVSTKYQLTISYVFDFEIECTWRRIYRNDTQSPIVIVIRMNLILKFSAYNGESPKTMHSFLLLLFFFFCFGNYIIFLECIDFEWNLTLRNSRYCQYFWSNSSSKTYTPIIFHDSLVEYFILFLKRFIFRFRILIWHFFFFKM